MHNPKQSKEEIRKQLLAKRDQLSVSDKQQKSRQIISLIRESEVFKAAQSVAFYHAIRGEANPAELEKNTREKQFYLPIISLDESQGLQFAPINRNTKYRNNKFSIPEPIVESNKLISAKTIDLVIMPLLGFDNQGNRLGMGGGYYDRCFAFKKTQVAKPALMGFAYDFQQVNSLTAEPWDIGLDMIATESLLKDFQSNTRS